MEYIKGRLDEAINGLEGYKNKYPKMKTQDVIDMLKRLLDLVNDEQLNIPVVSHQRELLAKYTKWQNEVNYSCDEMIYADIDKFLNG